MKNLLLILTALAAVLNGCDSSTTLPDSPGRDNGPPTFSLQFDGHSFQVELANTPQLRRQGLAHRQYLRPDRGMLFVFPASAKITMWMKGCKIPLDVFFFDHRQRLINFHTMAVPSPGQPDLDLPRYSSDKPAKYALELSARYIPPHRLKPGSVVIFSPELLKAIAKAAE